jgi:hypothetical protein
MRRLMFTFYCNGGAVLVGDGIGHTASEAWGSLRRSLELLRPADAHWYDTVRLYRDSFNNRSGP